MVFISGWILFVSGINGNVFKVKDGTWETKKQSQAGRLDFEDSEEQ